MFNNNRVLENFAPQHTDLYTELSQIVTSADFEGGTGIAACSGAFRGASPSARIGAEIIP